MQKVAVIGSGFGGLAIAIRLQSQGYDVTLFEKNAQPGGHAAQLKLKGYTFDMGPSLITAPAIIGDVFHAAGRRMEDYLTLEALDPFYRIFYRDGSVMDYSGDAGAMQAQMHDFHPADAANYERFMQAARGIYDAVISDGLGAKPFLSWRTMISFLPRALKLNALLPAYTFVKRFFRDARNRFAFSFHPLFIGGNPFRSPAVYLMIPYLERSGGVWFSKGGMYSLVQAFVQLLRDCGGSIRCNAEVNEILVNNGRAVGVRVGDESFEFDAVVSNADVTHTYQQLLPEQFRRHWTNNRLDKTKYSMSAFLIYLGVRRQYPRLLHHSLILSHRYKELVRDIFDNKILADDFSMYLHVPTRTDAGMAPAGCESMYVLIPVPNLAADIDWDVTGPLFAAKVLAFLEQDFGLEGLQENLDVMETYTPRDFARDRNSYLGSPWGIEPSFLQTAYFRPHNRSEDIERLYFVGAGTHPGAGVPGVLLSAEASEKLVMRELHQESSARSIVSD